MPAETPRAVTRPHIGHSQRHVGQGNGTERGPARAAPRPRLARSCGSGERTGPAPARRGRAALCRAPAALHGPSRPHPPFPHPPQVKQDPERAGDGPEPSQLTAECRSRDSSACDCLLQHLRPPCLSVETQQHTSSIHQQNLRVTEVGRDLHDPVQP